MPPKAKVRKEDILNAAVSLVREGSVQALNARNIAAALHCSTQPVFSNFATMAQLQRAVEAAAYERYLGYLQDDAKSGRYPPYKAFGMAYIRFAKEEKELFKLLFMCDREKKEKALTPDGEASIGLIMQANGISREKAQLMHLEMWAFVHGIATMLATNFLTLEWDLIGSMMSDVYQGVRARHISKEERK